ncbi:MAG: phosphatidylglycerophosphatase A [Deltaproteobacteria bacterium]|jgi:phosphatidylglycerophosphatase A|nr:phosphatidylglycerophosphatase A [Deltaproteobacteria bacterium]MCL5880156.1 phosphatidylglycerophosphatase A [Deltaproteobacteria bacterium]MDA8304794.1 phosphatidylglycerophosphatase A [Deltaproteobacteria bacterium]
MEKQKKFNLSIFISTFFYAGLFPYAPGTAGSIAGFIIYISLMRLLNPYEYIIICLLIFVAGVYYSSKAEKLIGVKDPPSLVIDEVLGYFITMMGGFWAPFSILYAFAGLLLFRFFDILKPFPVRYVDKKIGSGLGIMLDDVVAAIFSAIILRFIIVLTAGI